MTNVGLRSIVWHTPHNGCNSVPLIFEFQECFGFYSGFCILLKLVTLRQSTSFSFYLTWKIFLLLFQLFSEPAAARAMLFLAETLCKRTAGLTPSPIPPNPGEGGSMRLLPLALRGGASGLSEIILPKRSISERAAESTSCVAASKCSIWESDRMEVAAEAESTLETAELTDPPPPMWPVLLGVPREWRWALPGVVPTEAV